MESFSLVLMLDPLEGEQPNQALEYSSLCIFLEYLRVDLNGVIL